MKLLIGLMLLAGFVSMQAEEWLQWSASRARDTAKAAYVQGRVGGFFDMRMLKTETSYNYKLAATWMTRDVIRGTARTLQLTERLSDADTRALVEEADKAGDTVVMVEIDPREGSGIIPNDWSAFLQKKVSDPDFARAVRGVNTPALKGVKALAGVIRRNYDYDRFWVVFPLTHPDGKKLFAANDSEAELVVRIAGREGHVSWPIPAGVR